MRQALRLFTPLFVLLGAALPAQGEIWTNTIVLQDSATQFDVSQTTGTSTFEVAPGHNPHVIYYSENQGETWATITVTSNPITGSKTKPVLLTAISSLDEGTWVKVMVISQDEDATYLLEVHEPD